MKKPLNVRVERRPNQTAQVALEGSIDAHTFDQFSGAMTELVESGTLWIVADLRLLSYIGSVGISFLINLRVERRKQGGEVLLVAPQPSVHKILKMLGLLEVLVVTPTLEEAWTQVRARLQPSSSAGSGDLPLIE